MAGLYIHIPFCRQKCAYCDFFSSSNAAENMVQYIEALGNEWDIRKNEIDLTKLTTLYLGGGTPSLIPFALLKRLFDKLKKDIDILSLEEVTLEANPEDITSESLKRYSDLGINRVSVGIQSFASRELTEIGRDHTPKASREALQTLATAGFNYSADLMYGLPGQSASDWEKNLSELLSYSPPHFSAYLLSYEPGTRLYARMMQGKVEEATEEVAYEMFNILCNEADSAGYHHYEISNLALPGMEAIHNSSYWNYTPYIGLGPSAHSFDGNIRRFNPPGIKNYITKLLKKTLTVETDNENKTSRFNDYIITSLRTDRGFDFRMAEKLFGKRLLQEFCKQIPRLFENGDVEFSETNVQGKFLRIPRKRWLTSDGVMRELIL
ncbi:MAG: radical SAM family heme chaperone HemW [Bacteroidales bacterium]|nr:radical SAM family heme chaperone HemW [Bacteroidales bacterium]